MAAPKNKAPEPEAPEVEPEAEVEAIAESEGRREKFTATRPDGTVVIVDRNIDAGEQTITDK